ncbi:hypothetical protein Syun_003720 [Stephania yunnanensis]|uniref:Uncharacterized protein n=1 Tax=Stephania yunnanensis TaxID=152371 RepID=A0AAP0Q0H3_9MAGN
MGSNSPPPSSPPPVPPSSPCCSRRAPSSLPRQAPRRSFLSRDHSPSLFSLPSLSLFSSFSFSISSSLVRF